MSGLIKTGWLARLGSKGPLVYGAMPNGPGVRKDLIACLLAVLRKMAPEEGKYLEQGTVVLKAEPLGRPVLFVGGKPGPGVSFSKAGEWLWGVLAAQGRVGLDVALISEFRPPYPYSRVFLPEEWQWAWTFSQGDTLRAAALLWAAKEAAVKALGVGFHHWEPSVMKVKYQQTLGEGLALEVETLSAWVTAWACYLEDGCLALAVV